MTTKHWMIAALAALAFAIPQAAAAQQNLTVRPMQVQADVPANRTARVILRVRNNHPTESETMSLETLDLTQNRDGSLRMIGEEARAELDEDALAASSRDWIELPGDTVEVAPETTEEIPVLLRVPADARGAYTSAIRLRTAQPPVPEVEVDDEPRGFFSISFGFLVPITLQIEGRPARQDVSIGDLSMAFDDARDEDGEQVGEPTTRAFMEVVNSGRTYSGLSGEVVVERRSGANWRTVTRAQLPDRNIMPGLTLELPVNLGRRLPSGEYRLLGNLSVDGRRLPRFEREIEFEGDPAADTVAFDTEVTIEPPRVEMEAVAGATRSATVELGNPSDRPLEVALAVRTPEGLEGVAMGDIVGETLSAAGWTEMRPDSLTLAPGQARNVRVTSRLPREELEHANYYADLVVSGRYEDGQSAGETRSMLQLRHLDEDLESAGIVDRMGVSEADEPSAYVLQGRFVNAGNHELSPNLTAELIDGSGNRVETWRVQSDGGPLLPLGLRDFAVELDLSSVEAGDYQLRVIADHDGDRLSDRQLSVRIEHDEDDNDEDRVRTLSIQQGGG